MAQHDLLSKAEQISKVVALAAVILYAAGFLIVSIYLSSLGISTPFALRPRMIGAGLLFGSIVAVAVYIGRLAAQKDLFDSLRPGHNRSLRVLSRFTLVQMLAIWVGLLLRSTQDAKIASFWPLIFFAILPTLAAFIALFLWQRQISIRVRMCSAFALLGLSWLSLLTFLFRDHGVERFGLSAWIFAVGVSVASFDLRIENRFSPLIQIGGEIPILVGLAVFFAVSVFPHFSQQWGGGAPTPVTVTFGKEGGYLAGSVKKTLLIDESELGIYVTDRTLKESFFIPRSAIALIHYTDQ